MKELQEMSNRRSFYNQPPNDYSNLEYPFQTEITLPEVL